jgi:hypothetical protein
MFRYFLAGLGILGMLGLAGFLLTRYGAAQRDAGKQEERVVWQDKVVAAERHIADLRAANERRVAAAQGKYVERIETFKPVLVTNKETVTRYAQTPAGAVQCLSAERVLGISETRAALFSSLAIAPGEGSATLPPDTIDAGGDDKR